MAAGEPFPVVNDPEQASSSEASPTMAATEAFMAYMTEQSNTFSLLRDNGLNYEVARSQALLSPGTDRGQLVVNTATQLRKSIIDCPTEAIATIFKNAFAHDARITGKQEESN